MLHTGSSQKPAAEHGRDKCRRQHISVVLGPYPFDLRLLPVITSVDHKGVTGNGLRGRGVESRSSMTSVETRDLPGKVDRSRMNSNTKRVGKSRHLNGGMFTTVAILNEKSFDP